MQHNNNRELEPSWMHTEKALTVKEMREKMDKDIHYWRRQVGLPPLQDEDRPDQ
jgi:hypothetical protein